MKIFDKTLQNLKEYPILAKEIISFAGDCRRFVFLGNLGAGKTTLIQNICSYFGVEDAVNSPTFSLINKYQGFKNEAHKGLMGLIDPNEIPIGF